MKIEEIKSAFNILDFALLNIPDLKKNGKIWKGRCPIHGEKTPSFTIYPKDQKFYCFGCGAKGDIIDLAAKIHNTDQDGAIKILSGNAGLAPARVEVFPDEKDDEDGFEFLNPAPNPPKTIKHPTFGGPSRVWPYVDQNSQLLFYVCRWDDETGKKKAVMPYTPWRKNRRVLWRFKGVPPLRPLYGLDRLRDGHTVGIFEGEKTADAAQELFPHVDCLSWQGGSKAVKKSDWSVLKGKRILIFPDCDQPGHEALMDVFNELTPICEIIKVVKPLNTKKGWDFADWTGTSDAAIAYAKSNIFEVHEFVMPDVIEPEPEQTTSEANNQVSDNEHYPEQNLPFDKDFSYGEHIRFRAEDIPYKSLGYQNNDHVLMYWFFARDTNSILCYKSGQLSKDDIIKEIASANYWEAEFGSRNGKINCSAIAEKLRSECRQAGLFDPSMIRGRGAWIDDERFVLNLGDCILVDGEKNEIAAFKSRYAYQTKQSIGFPNAKPFAPAEASKLLELLSRFNWERKIAATLIAGWCVIAPFAGALFWRPHIWIIGGAATGKSWILQNAIRKALGKMHLALQSKTTEPAIRQACAGDSLAIVFDEFEAENEIDAARVQSIIDLARSSSSSDGGQIVKGSTSGKTMNYQMRNCFCFASIASTIKHRSDEGRITTFSLGSSDPKAKEENRDFLQKVMTDDFAARLQARTISLMPVLLANIETFSKACADHLGDTRSGDQIGPMIAGAYLLKRSDKVSYEKALEWVRAQDWSDEQPRSENRDEVQLLQAILSRLVKVDGKNAVERTIGELIYIGFGQTDSLVTADGAIDKLLRIGINPKPDGIYISLNSQELKRNILRGTQLAISYGKILSRLDGAVMANDIKFSSGIVSRSVFIPAQHYK